MRLGDGPEFWAATSALFVAGLVGSLHCVVMCGPLHAAAARLQAKTTQSPLSGALVFQLGRVWTYGLLGLLVGLAGVRLEAGLQTIGWLRPVAVAAGLLMVAAGVTIALRGGTWLPQRCLSWLGSGRGFGGALRSQPKVVLGALSGLVPCGLVYAALLVAATAAKPWQAAAAMVAFGAGTLVPLTALTVGSVRLPPRWAARESAVTSGLLMVGGSLLLLRVWAG